MLIPDGTLIRVTDKALRDDGKAEHGKMWVVTGNDSEGYDRDADRVLYTCVAITTGYDHLWFPYEMEQDDGDT